MHSLNTRLTVDVSGVDQTTAMASFSDDRTANFISTHTGDQLQIQFTKALNVIFVYVTGASPANVTSLSITATNPSGDAITINNLVDDTKGLSQSGFIYWDPPFNDNITIESGDIFTYTFAFNNPLDDNTQLGGVNLLFCDKFDLLREYPDLDTLLEVTVESDIPTKLIRIMEAVRNDIDSTIMNSIFRKIDPINISAPIELDRWDLLQIDEVKTAAVYLTLGKLFYFLSDSPNDVYSARSARYSARGQQLFESTNLSIDLNDNGSFDIIQGERQIDNIGITFEL